MTWLGPVILVHSEPALSPRALATGVVLIVMPAGAAPAESDSWGCSLRLSCLVPHPPGSGLHGQATYLLAEVDMSRVKCPAPSRGRRKPFCGHSLNADNAYSASRRRWGKRVLADHAAGAGGHFIPSMAGKEPCVSLELPL